MKELSVSFCLHVFFIAVYSLELMQGATPGPDEHSGFWSSPAPEASGMWEATLWDLLVSNITDHGFGLSWKADAGAYTSFVVEYEEVTLAAGPPAEVFMPGESLGAVIDGLQANTTYKVKVYGMAGGQRSHPLEAVATTGTPFLFLNRATTIYWILQPDYIAFLV